MRLISLLLASAASIIIATPVFAQQIQRSSNPQGVQIQGDTEVKADQDKVRAEAKGEANEAKNAAVAIKDGTQIQGATRVTASQRNTSARAEGKNNKAGNEAGVIGGN